MTKGACDKRRCQLEVCRFVTFSSGNVESSTQKRRVDTLRGVFSTEAPHGMHVGSAVRTPSGDVFWRSGRRNARRDTPGVGVRQLSRELSYPQSGVYFGEALGETHVGDTPGVGIRQFSGELSYAHEGLDFREALGETHGLCPIRQFCPVRPFIIFNSGGGIVVWAPDPPRAAHTTCQATNIVPGPLRQTGGFVLRRPLCQTAASFLHVCGATNFRHAAVWGIKYTISYCNI